MLHPITQMTWPRTIASSTRALDRPFLRGLSPWRGDRLRFVLRAIALPTMAAFFANGRSTATASSCETIWIKTVSGSLLPPVKAFNDNPEGLIPEYPFFPDPLHEPHLGTFTKFRGQLGDAQGVERSDKVGRRRDVARQFMFFDAPVGLIF